MKNLCAGFDLTPDKPAACRTHADGLGDQISYLTAFHTDEPAQVRPEFGVDADINVIVARYGFTPANGYPVGVADYDITYREALDTAKAAQTAFDRLPQDLRDLYPNWESLLAATLNGDLSAAKAPTTTPEEPPAPAGQTAAPASTPSPQ